MWIISNKPLERQYQDVEPQVRAALDRRITTNEEFKSDEEFAAIIPTLDQLIESLPKN